MRAGKQSFKLNKIQRLASPWQGSGAHKLLTRPEASHLSIRTHTEQKIESLRTQTDNLFPSKQWILNQTPSPPFIAPRRRVNVTSAIKTACFCQRFPPPIFCYHTLLFSPFWGIIKYLSNISCLVLINTPLYLHFFLRRASRTNMQTPVCRHPTSFQIVAGILHDTVYRHGSYLGFERGTSIWG